MKYQLVSGLETHVELATATKIFCGCTTAFGGAPNTHCCPVCTGQPGALPILNKRVVEFAIRAGLATHCTINTTTHLDRKNYCYPDLPKAYQISQFDKPLCEHGYVELESGKRIGITRIHIEEDAGKLVHESGFTFIDYNRGGVPLIEIVSEPDISSPEESREYVEKLQLIMRYIGVSDCKMQEGSMRCDVNISLMPVGSTKFGTRTEIKNMNSLSYIEKAMAYEYSRQAEILDNGGEVVQATMRYDEHTGETSVMRTKEDAQDYRYFPEPDLMPVELTEEQIEAVRASLPELPEQKRERYVKEFSLTDYDAHVLTLDRNLAAYFEHAAEHSKAPKLVANWIIGDFMRLLGERKMELADCPVKPESLAAMVDLIQSGAINGKIAKTVFEEMFQTGKEPDAIVREKGLVQVSDESAITGFVDQVIAANPAQVQQYRDGKTAVIQYLVGQVMKTSRGKANPQMVLKLLKEKLS